MSVTIYHNPRCSKSRQTLALIRERGLEPEVIDYLGQPPSASEIKRIIELLGVRTRDVIRSGEAAYRDLGLGDDSIGDEALIEAIRQHPILLQRPIVIVGDQARIGRPPESVEAILP